MPFGQMPLCGCLGSAVIPSTFSEMLYEYTVQLGFAVQFSSKRRFLISFPPTKPACYRTSGWIWTSGDVRLLVQPPPGHLSSKMPLSHSDLAPFFLRANTRRASKIAEASIPCPSSSWDAELSFLLYPSAEFRGCRDDEIRGKITISSGREVLHVAPKKRIGGSGTLATVDFPCSDGDNMPLWVLEEASRAVSSFFLTLLLMGLFCLAHLILSTMPGQGSPLGCLCSCICSWAPTSLALGLGCVCSVGSSTKGVCLDWRPCHLTRKAARQRGYQRQVYPRQQTGRLHPQAGQKSCHVWPNLPRPVKPVRPLFGALPAMVLFVSAVQPAAAMTAPYGAWEFLGPEELPPARAEEPSHLGPTVSYSNDVQLPWLCVAQSASPHVHELPIDNPAALDADTEKWIGVYVYTPMYHTTIAAVQPTRDARAYGIIDAVHDHVGGVPHELFPAVVPVVPQRTPGVASLLRMPRVLRLESDTQSTAIIFDLTRVGGNYFAEVVPRFALYADIEARILAQVAHSEHRARMFLGRNDAPCTVGAPLTFFAGAVLTVAWSDTVDMFRGSFEDLLEAEETWLPISQLPPHTYRHGTLVQYRGNSFFFDSHSVESTGLAKAVADALKLDLLDITTCGFPFSDLEHKGYACDSLFSIFDMPWPQKDELQSQRRDLFTLCDGRSLGVVPSVLHTCHPVVHLPSLAAKMLIHLPLAMRLNAVGGRRVFDEVFLEGHTSLYLYASHESSFSEGAPDDEVPSSDIARAEGEQQYSPQSPEAPWETRDEGIPAAWLRRPTIFTPEATRIAGMSFDEILQDADVKDCGILGVALLAPHFQTEHIAIHLCSGEGVPAVISRARQAATRIPVAHLDCSVAIEPVPFEGFAAVMVFSRVLDFNDNVAILIDLSNVGGKRFPATLPKSLNFAA